MSGTQHDGIAGLVELLDQRLGVQGPGPVVLRGLLGVAFTASLRSEEGVHPRFELIWIDPANPDPNAPQTVRVNRWRIYPLDSPKDYTVRNLVKLASATDPRTSALAVHGTSLEDCRIWGLVDQRNGLHRLRNNEGYSGAYKPPGQFQLGVDGIGILTARDGYELIGRLRVDDLRAIKIDPLIEGPIHQRLFTYALITILCVTDKLKGPLVDDESIDSESFFDLLYSEPEWATAELLKVLDEFNQAPRPDSLDDVSTLAKGPQGGSGPSAKSVEVLSPETMWTMMDEWLGTIRRILARVRLFGHGGTLLLLPDQAMTCLDVKYRLSYPRLSGALLHLGLSSAQLVDADRSIYGEFDVDPESVDIGDHHRAIGARSAIEDAASALEDAIWFVACLTRVDGLVVLDPLLNVLGFGAIIRTEVEPNRVLKAASADSISDEPIDYGHFGTRHQSMMRLCHEVPGAIGFVVSQDGDVRAITKVGEDVVVWDGIELENPRT